mgnify:CR=1 FL=1
MLVHTYCINISDVEEVKKNIEELTREDRTRDDEKKLTESRIYELKSQILELETSLLGLQTDDRKLEAHTTTRECHRTPNDHTKPEHVTIITTPSIGLVTSRDSGHPDGKEACAKTHEAPTLDISQRDSSTTSTGRTNATDTPNTDRPGNACGTNDGLHELVNQKYNHTPSTKTSPTSENARNTG